MKIIYLILMTLMGSFGSLFLKKSTQINKNIFCNKYFYIGGILYFLSAILNIYLLKKFNYSTLLPLTSLTYLWSIILAKIYLKEYLSSKKIIGLCILMLGIYFVIK